MRDEETYLVKSDDDTRVFTEVVVDVFERTARSFGIEEVCEWNEGAVEDRPDDVELPVEVLDTNLSDFDDHTTQVSVLFLRCWKTLRVLTN